MSELETNWCPNDDVASEDAVVTTTSDGVVLSWNHGAERLFGWSAHEVLGKNVGFLFPDKHREIDELNGKDAASGATVRNSLTKAMHRGGSVISLIYTLTPIRDRSGAVVSVLRILKDISAFRRAQFALREAMAQVCRMDSVQDGILRELSGFSDSAVSSGGPGVDIVAAENLRSRGEFLHILADECRMIEALAHRLKDHVRSMVPSENRATLTGS